MSEIADWVFEGVLQFLRSPLWTTPIHGFIEKHCHEFAADEEENKLVYTQLHNEFRTLVDELLSSFLSELGVEGEAFIDAIKSGENQELSSMVAEFLFALDDFPSFRALMEKKNLELELEAMYDYAKMSSQLTQEDVDDMTDEERFLFQMAVQLSLGDSDITMKRVEKEDAELLQALALSLAVEQERLVREQISEDANANANPAAAATGDAPPPPPARTVTSPGRTAEEIHEEVRQQRVANVERALFELQANQNGPQVTHASLAPIGPSQDAQRIVQKALAPIGEKRSGNVFGSRGAALPSIAGSGSSAQQMPPPPSTSSTTAQPSFQELKQQAESRLGGAGASNGSGEPSKEEMEQRAAYFKSQRERLIQQKAASRAQELEQYKREQGMVQGGGAVAPPSTATTTTTTESEATKEMRVALARRFREDLIQETRKAAGQ